MSKGTKETVIRLIELSFDKPEQLEKILSEKKITSDAMLLRQRARQIILQAKNKDEAITLLKESL